MFSSPQSFEIYFASPPFRICPNQEEITWWSKDIEIKADSQRIIYHIKALNKIMAFDWQYLNCNGATLESQDTNSSFFLFFLSISAYNHRSTETLSSNGHKDIISKQAVYAPIAASTIYSKTPTHAVERVLQRMNSNMQNQPKMWLWLHQIKIWPYYEHNSISSQSWQILTWIITSS